MTLRAARPSVYTIPPSVSFVDALAASLLERYGDDPLGLSRLRLLLPNRRSLRSLREALLREGRGRGRLLPRLSAIGDVDEEAFAFLPGVAESLSLPPAIPEARRIVLLARLVMRYKQRRGEPASPAGALRLARELARFIDSVHTERLSFEALDELVPEELAAHWQVTLDFLRIVTREWPKLLAVEGVLDPADRRNRLIGALAERWRQHPPEDPVIAAGTTGSIPATAELLGVIARLPQGAVILPGFDTGMCGETRHALAPGHPQYLMSRLLETMQVAPEEVEDWPLTPAHAELAEARRARMRWLAAATGLDPPQQPEAMAGRAETASRAVAGLTRIDCADPREEAGVIALAMREALETPGRRVALVTPDRRLARRVRAALARWKIDVDDSAGQPVAASVPGSFLRLVAAAVASGLAPVALLSLFKHPLAAGGRAPGVLRRLARAIDRHESRAAGPFLRGPKPAPGIDALLAAAAAVELPKKSQQALADTLAPLRPLEEALTGNEPPAVLLDRHLEAAEALAATDCEHGAERLWRGPAGEALVQELVELREALGDMPAIEGAGYLALFDAMVEPLRVRPPYGHHPRLAILGPIEARLHHADLMILGGLNEGSWPPALDHDPWMGRQMRRQFGLPDEDRRIGQAAHDFLQASGAPQVILTRAEKVDGTPTLEARWLAQLEALGPPLPRGGRLRAIEAALDTPEAVQPCSPPRPTPPTESRPDRLSVTQVELWMRDPYALYARHILGLDPLPALEADPAAAERGTVMHHALDMFMKRRSSAGSEKQLQALLDACGREAFGPLLARPAVRAFWWPRFLGVAQRFLELQDERAGTFETLATEVRGTLRIEGSHPFTLTAKADRIDRRRAEGCLEIIDYKTGSPPQARQIEAGYAPQLPLEGWMAEAGAFDGLAPAEIGGLAYWQLRGTREPIHIQTVKDAERHIRAAAAGLGELIARFARAETPYLSNPRPYPQFMGYGEYDHLARVAEWRTLPEVGDDDVAATGGRGPS